MTEEKETCSYYHVGKASSEKDWMVQLLCKQLDKIGVTYTFEFKEHWCGMSPAATFIVFDEEQNRAWIEENVRMWNTPEISDRFKHTVAITSGNLIDCDNWLIENFGLMEDAWTAEFGNNFNQYHFKEDVDAMAFKLKFS